MQNQDLIVLKRLKEWRDANQRAVLVTVMRTWGSSPRPIGSIMAMCETGAVVGSVSGGCIEDDLIREFTQPADGQNKPGMAMEGVPKRMRYGITADEAHRFGLPCGGTLELLLEFNPDAQLLTELIEQLERGDLVRRVTDMNTGAVTLEPTETADSLRVNEDMLVNTFGPSYRMLLIGAGQLGEYIATMAIFNGFTVTVCDPREEYASGWTTTGVNRMSEWPDDAVKLFKPDRRTCVLALTHDPKLDDLALLEALETEAFYVGAIGSRSNNAARRKRMIEHFGQTEESLARLRGPIGIYIGSKTPAEISVSVMAEVLAVKNGVPLPRDMDVAHAKSAQEKAGS
ncbi:MAG: XdhC family protein [Burkholderiaceae bacterium]|nr:XdhC family protein [Burkholderiaceae bacterium]MCD8516925.1 XdhC family protein [Burkholderiaceae bacterium]MCD8537556.1 XdhC family protein [Burkholderiaceae bacterium]MCD8565633.1 XdhC family protein [Burkholderiaceae bacterium]